MPSGYLHKRCAKAAAQNANLSSVDINAMTLGAQGPDPLFMLGIFPLSLKSKPSKLGNLLHEYRTGKFLCTLCRRAKDATVLEQSYAMGFLTHYALDSTVHPYVYGHSADADGKYSSARHMRLEKHWDSLYYHADGNKGTPVIMPGIAETQPNWPALAAFWQGVIMEVFPEQSVTPAMIEKAFADADKANRLTHSPHGVKYGLVWLLERVIGKPGLATSQMSPRFPSKKDITNAAHLPWHSPFEPERERTEGLEDLCPIALQRATDYVLAASLYFSGETDEQALAAVLGNVGYDSGLPSKP